MARRNYYIYEFGRFHSILGMSCNFHTGAEVFNYPWDTWNNLTADDGWWQNVASMYADTVHDYSSPGYFDYLNNGITNGWDFSMRLMGEDKIL